MTEKHGQRKNIKTTGNKAGLPGNEPGPRHFRGLSLLVSLACCLAHSAQSGPAMAGDSNSTGRVGDSTVAATGAPGLSGTERYITENLARADKAIKAGRYQEALKLATVVTEIDPDSAIAWQYKGMSYRGMLDYRNSRAAWQKAYETEKSPHLREAIAWYLKSMPRIRRRAPARRPEAARTAQNTALPAQEIEELLNRGVDYYVSREFGKSREMFAKVLAAEPGNLDAQIALNRLKEVDGL